MYSFATNHFSTYTLAEKVDLNNISNPNTLDNINYYIILMITTIGGIIILTICNKKKKL